MLYPGTRVFANGKKDSKSVSRSQVNEQILAAHQVSSAKPGDTWVKALSLKCVQKNQKRSAEPTTSERRQHDLIAMVNGMGFHLQKFANIFNEHATDELHVSFSEPTFNSDHTVYQTRVYTQNFCLIVRGISDSIEFFVLPVNQFFDFGAHSYKYEPVMTMHAVGRPGASGWAVEGDTGVLSDIGKVCRRAFEDFIHTCMVDLCGGDVEQAEEQLAKLPCGSWWAPRRDSFNASTVARLVNSQIDWE